MAAPVLFLAFVIIGVASGIAPGVFCAGVVAAASILVICPKQWRGAVAAVAVACGCGAYGASARDAALASPLSAALAPVLDDRLAPPVWLSGVLHEDAVIDADGARISLDVDRVAVGDRAAPWRSVHGRAQVGVGGTFASGVAAAWVRGRRVTAPVLVKRPQIWRNPGSPSERWQRLRRGVDITGSVKSAALVDVTAGPPWSELGAGVRARVRSTLAAIVGASSRESAGITTAILIGDRTGLDDETVRALQMAGTYHVIAISGGNIAIVVAACLVVLRLVLRSPRVVAALTLVVVLAYGALVGDQASVSRAVTAGAVVLLLQMLGWCAPSLRIFGLAALVVALADPLVVIDVGAWLSFGATLGILLFAGPTSQRIARGRHPVVVGIAAMAAATIAAELALMPISAAVFARVSIAGLLLNFIAIPAMTVTQLAGTAIVLLDGFAPALSRVLGVLAHAGAWALVRSTLLLRVAPWLTWQTPPVSWMWTAAYYAGIVAALTTTRWRIGRRAAVAASALSLIVILWSPAWLSAQPSPGMLRVSMLDVGQGQAIAVQFPTGQSMLLDAGGSASSFDIGARVVEPALWALGIQRLDWLAVTHGDVDHAGGAPSVLRDMRPREVWEGVPVPRDVRMQSLRARAHDDGAVWRRLATGHNFEVGSVLVEILNPPLPDWERRDNRNDDSVVMRVNFGQVSLLLTGDVERAAEDGLSVDRTARLRLLSAPHHGSRTSSTPGLLKRLLPHAVFVSAGRANTFGHPAPDVLARYERLGVEVFRTDLDGAITIETDGRVVFVSTTSGRSWRLSYVQTGQGGE